jgi:predicted Zn-dependent protease
MEINSSAEQEKAARPVFEQLAQGIHLFEEGRVDESLELMASLHRSEPRDARVRSYYGLCVAIGERRFEDGFELCQSAAKQEFFNPELYLNLARLHLSFGFKEQGLRYLRRGLMIDPADADLARMLNRLGDRLSPVLSFLPRKHPINRWLGSARHVIARKLPFPAAVRSI